MTNASTAKPNTLPQLWNQKQLAEYLGKSTAWCERARWAGYGPKFIRLGRHVRYRVEDVHAWIDERSVVAKKAEQSC